MVVLYMAPNKDAALRRGSALTLTNFNGLGRSCPKRPVQSGFGLPDAEVAKVSQRAQKEYSKYFRTFCALCVTFVSFCVR